MKIAEQTIDTLKEIGYCIHFQDEFLNIVDPQRATEMYIGFIRVGSEITHVGKTIKSTKKETTIEYVLAKINSEKAYKSFAHEFNKIISKIGASAYPTTYGIGVFVAVGFRSAISETKSKIELALKEIGVAFTTEYSDAGWVLRYKISKSVSNFSIIEKWLIKENA